MSTDTELVEEVATKKNDKKFASASDGDAGIFPADDIRSRDHPSIRDDDIRSGCRASSQSVERSDA